MGLLASAKTSGLRLTSCQVQAGEMCSGHLTRRMCRPSMGVGFRHFRPFTCLPQQYTTVIFVEGEDIYNHLSKE